MTVLQPVDEVSTLLQHWKQRSSLKITTLAFKYFVEFPPHLTLRNLRQSYFAVECLCLLNIKFLQKSVDSGFHIFNSIPTAAKNV